jgi:hypothetical protein
MAAELESGATCGSSDDAPGVGGGVDELVAAITARAGVISTSPATVTIGGHKGQMLDLQLAPSRTNRCRAPEGLIIGVGLSPDHPVRLILLDLGNGRTMAVVIFDLEPSNSVKFQRQVAEMMPIIESFEIHPPTP